MAKRRKKRKSLTSHILWGAVSGITGLWTAKQYWKALPEPIKEGYHDKIESRLPEMHTTTTSDYAIAAGIGAVYGVAAYKIPMLRFVRKLIFGSAIWTYRGTKIVSLLGGVHQAQSSHPFLALTKRAVSKKGFEAVLRRAER